MGKPPLKNLHYETGGKEYNGKSITSKKNQLMRQNVIFFFICKDKYIYIYIYILKEVPEVLITMLDTIKMVPQADSISLIGNQNYG